MNLFYLAHAIKDPRASTKPDILSTKFNGKLVLISLDDQRVSQFTFTEGVKNRPQPTAKKSLAKRLRFELRTLALFSKLGKSAIFRKSLRIWCEEGLVSST